MISYDNYNYLFVYTLKCPNKSNALSAAKCPNTPKLSAKPSIRMYALILAVINFGPYVCARIASLQKEPSS